MASSDDSGRGDLRSEIKLVGDIELLGEIRAALLLHPSALAEAHAPRRVQSVYLDTHEGRGLNENLSGVSDRVKVRFRWYGDLTRGVSGVLERKVRSNSFGYKRRSAVARELDVEGVERRAFARALAAACDERTALELEGLEPAQWIRYRRRYLASADRRVRVTLDSEIEAFDQRFLPRLSSRLASPMPRVLVVECKASPEHYDALRELLNTFPLVVGRCSKYVMACQRGGAPPSSAYPS